ncbi:uncharacterized protein [Cardiocondyla obscurior]|uniref:uncharacterized protein n=1 Tax=Cardiocondyla obscurior TaxID=286306 RepID=UPI00396571FA
MTSISIFITNAKADLVQVSHAEILTRLEILDGIHCKFQENYRELTKAITEEEFEASNKSEESEFDEKYCNMRAELMNLAKNIAPAEPSTFTGQATSNDAILQHILAQQNDLIQKLMERPVENGDSSAIEQVMEQQAQLLERMSTRSSASVREAQVKLPTVKLPTFDGEPEEWKRYYETFRTLIHESELTNCLFKLPQVKRESADAIQALVDHVQKHLRVLQGMKLSTASWRALIIHLIEKNLDGATRRSWEKHIEAMEEMNTETMLDFLHGHSQLLRRANMGNEIGDRAKSEAKERGNQNKSRPPKPSRTVMSTTTQEGRCYLCQGDHLMYICKKFLAMLTERRIEELKKLRLCLNCFRSDHFVKNCRAGSCRECGKRHNTLLCHKHDRDSDAAARTEAREALSGSAKSSAVLCSIKGTWAGASESGKPSRAGALRRQVLMVTTIVIVKSCGQDRVIRVLLDSASEVNFISKAASKFLGVRLENTSELISGLNNMNCDVNRGCRLSMKSRISEFEIDVYCLVVPKITNFLPSTTVGASVLTIPEHIQLADPHFKEPGKIDALIGGELFMKLLETRNIDLGDDLPVFQNTKFGWVVSGPVPSHAAVRAVESRVVNTYMCLATTNASLEKTLQEFWRIEEYADNTEKLLHGEQKCEIKYATTTYRDIFGRFVVRLPFRDNKSQLGQSKGVTMRRLRYLETKFKRKPKLHDLYSEFMREYIELKHMTQITENASSSGAVYLPHHGVMREASSTTKLRLVFDASAKTSSGVSLNDTLMIGATLQDSLINIILRFRLPVVAITADLQKMYRQVQLHPDDRDYQGILWRFDARDLVEEYRLNTVTYGQSSAPYLAIRSVRRLAEDEAQRFPRAASVLLSDLYVDDIITGAENERDARNLVLQIRKLLRRGGFETHKWQSNCRSCVDGVSTGERAEELAAVEIDSGATKVLGLTWQPKSDTFQFSIEPMKKLINTKRGILSAISRLFDPLKLVGPILTRAKLIMQRTWLSKQGWDDPLSGDLCEAWEAYSEDLQRVTVIKIPRRVIQGSEIVHINLHAFCDASMKAYGVCIYLQAVDASGRARAHLVCSKSRVAPVKSNTITLPRLELCGAVVLARLTQNMLREEEEKLTNDFFTPNDIEWSFIPPSSPHMGGLWEAGVKSCKFYLKLVIGETLVTFEELTTVLTQIEVCLNSRPTCQLPSSATDLQPLTPGHFLDSNAPPLKWKLGRILETHKGTNDKVRVVTIKTASGILKRNANKNNKVIHQLASVIQYTEITEEGDIFENSLL